MLWAIILSFHRITYPSYLPTTTNGRSRHAPSLRFRFVSVSFPFRFRFVACLADWPGGCCAREMKLPGGWGHVRVSILLKRRKKREEKEKGGVCHAERDEDGAMKMGRNGTRTRRVRVPSTSRNEPPAPRRPDLPGEYLTGWIGIKVMV